MLCGLDGDDPDRRAFVLFVTWLVQLDNALDHGLEVTEVVI